MLRPSRDDFHALARQYTVVPVWRELLADLITPVAAFARLAAGRRARRSCSSRSSTASAGAAAPSSAGRRRPRSSPATGASTSTAGCPRRSPSTPASSPRSRRCSTVYRSPPLPELPPLHGGLVGYLGYDVVREVERLPAVPPDDLGHPDAVLSVIGELAAFDHWRQRVTLIANVMTGEIQPTVSRRGGLDAAYDEAVARLDRLAADGARPLDEPLVDPPDPDDPLPEVRSSMSGSLLPARGRRWPGSTSSPATSSRSCWPSASTSTSTPTRSTSTGCCARSTRARTCTSSATRRSPLVGSSPEPMVQLLDGRVISRPIAGTRRRGRTDEDDRRLAAELAEHPKEIAEHVMLVDLARNDVGRVVRFGTEQVDEMMTLERYSHVMHLTSQVSGDAGATGSGPIDVLRATLPAGTVSGAPKVRAMEIIDELEPTKRGPYAGVVGYLDFSGNLDTAIAIRTMVCQPDGRASVQAGAGIVADSVPEHEDLECHNKARALLAAVPAARRMSAARRG